MRSVLCVALLPLCFALHSSRLQPDGSHASAKAGEAVRFTFSPEADEQGVEMLRFSIKVWQGQSLVAQKDVESSDPTTELMLEPGRYTWGVQWWSTSTAASAMANSQVVVAPPVAAWKGVPWLGAKGSNEFSANFSGIDVGKPLELMVATLGFGYVTVNDKEISNDLLSYSGWTNTEKRVLYRTYDISALVGNDGLANLHVALGCGYRCDSAGKTRMPAYDDKADRSNDTIAKIFRLQILSGDTPIFHSGSDGWMSRQGPVVDDSVYDGETFKTSAITAWAPAKSLPEGWGPKGAMVAAMFPGVQAVRTDAPLSITQPAPGVHVVDFGSNVAGVCQISVPMTGSINITLKHGELKQHAHLPDLKSPDPSRVYFGNLRTAEQADTLVTDGPVKDWMPRFTYHGFRYVEVYNYPGNLTTENIRRLRMSAAVQDKVKANFSDEVLQLIHEGSKGAQRNNLMGVVTDCPQRDERLGWMGDTSLSVESMLLHFEMGSFSSAFADSMVDEMGEDGSLPDVVPFQRFGGRPADLSWSAAFISSLTSLWQEAGDLTAAGNHWAAVKAQIGNLQAQYKKAGALNKVPEPYGDWCPPPATPGSRVQEKPSKGFAAAFSLVRAIQQAADLGTALGGGPAIDAKAYAALAESLRIEFHKDFYDSAKKQYDNGAMITNVLPLALNAVPSSVHQTIVQNLLNHIKAKNGTWSGGIINNRFLFDTLHDNGAADVAVAMLKKRDYPSYGYMYFNEFEPARECMWELPDAPYQGTGMNSRNHHMFSSVGHYLVTRVAGLSYDPRGQEIIAVVSNEQSSSATLHGTKGLITFSWSRNEGRLEVDVSVPVSMRAYVHVPVADGPMDAGRVTANFQVVKRHGASFNMITLNSGRHKLVSSASSAPLSAAYI